ncbi:ASIC5 [Bugula neritina]|uniref:ASIC5 n=1 Tax=Bugula neritina TaxID=10212 RepID=A0A7J7JGS9_BUGNE|nr:ASIC5 [Bugula neritina]
MPREEEEVKTAEEEEEIYELYWAQNTSAHGVARIISTARVQRAVWIVVLAACFVYVTYEIYQSIHTYHQFLTTTEISKINKEKIEFPAVTFCNFNRWRKSHLTEEALANLRKVLSVYSYDYVIPELSDSSDQVKVSNLASLLDQEETTPAAIVTTTTPPTKSTCMLPLAFNGLNFHLSGDYSNLERTATSEGSNITFYCEGNNFVPMDGALEQTCTENGTFSDQPPLCVNMAQTGLIYSVSHKQSLTPMAISSNFRYVNSSSVSNGMTLCFWVKTLRRSQLGTVLSYGYGGEWILKL